MLASMADSVESAAQEFDPSGMRSEQESGDLVIVITACFVRRSIRHFTDKWMLDT
jgi:hypothetical protein